MSSDPQPSQRGFHQVVATTIVLLMVAAASLSVANARQGPRLTSAEVNVSATVQRSGQRLLLRTDQNVTPVADQVVVTPEVLFEVSSDGPVVMLRFGRPLDYATTYDVVVPVRSAATGAASTFSHSLRTPDATMYLLQRVGTQGNDGPEDEVVQTSTAGTGRQVVHRGSDVQGFAVAEPAIAVVSQDAEAGEKLVVTPLDQSGPSRFVGDRAVFTRLKSSGPGGLFGYLVGPQDPAEQQTPRLELYDSVTGEATRVKGIDGLPLTPLDFLFIPGTRSVVVQMDDSSFSSSIPPREGHRCLSEVTNGCTGSSAAPPGSSLGTRARTHPST